MNPLLKRISDRPEHFHRQTWHPGYSDLNLAHSRFVGNWHDDRRNLSRVPSPDKRRHPGGDILWRRDVTRKVCEIAVG